MFTLFQTDFMPHGFCIRWSWDLLTLYVLSDGLIFLAYSYIGIALILFAKKHIGLAWNRLLWLFSFFVLACGITHLMGIVVFWHPLYWQEAILKSITAVLSLTTAIYLAPKIPELLDLHSNDELDSLINRLLTEKKERKKAELLKENYFEHYAAINDAAVIAETDTLGTITFANDHFCLLSGYSREELIGSTYRIVKSNVHSSDFYHALWATIQSGKIWRGEICNRHKNGELYWVNSVIVPILDMESTPPKPKKYITIRFDITERKRAEQSQLMLRNQVNQMQYVERMNQLASSMASDFDQTLSVIIDCNQLNLSMAKNCQDKTIQHDMALNATHLAQATQYAENLAKKMAQYATQHRLHRETAQHSQSKKAVIERVLATLMPLFHYEMDIDENVVLPLEAACLHQLATHLLIEAHDVMAKDGNTLTITLKKFSATQLTCHRSGVITKGEGTVLCISKVKRPLSVDALHCGVDTFSSLNAVTKSTEMGLVVLSEIVHDCQGHLIVQVDENLPNQCIVIGLLFFY